MSTSERPYSLSRLVTPRVNGLFKQHSPRAKHRWAVLITLFKPFFPLLRGTSHPLMHSLEFMAQFCFSPNDTIQTQTCLANLTQLPFASQQQVPCSLVLQAEVSPWLVFGHCCPLWYCFVFSLHQNLLFLQSFCRGFVAAAVGRGRTVQRHCCSPRIPMWLNIVVYDLTLTKQAHGF